MTAVTELTSETVSAGSSLTCTVPCSISAEACPEPLSKEPASAELTSLDAASDVSEVPTAPEVSCTVTVACQAEALPELRAAGGALEADGTLFSAPCTVTENSTVLEALKTAAEAAGCPVTTQGSPAYVTAIGDLAAGAHGEASGWTYTVNGEMVMDSCDTRTVQAGDQILWTYVTAWT